MQTGPVTTSNQPQQPRTGWSAELRGTTPQPIDKILWKLAWHSYGPNRTAAALPWDPLTQPPVPLGWRRLGAHDVAGLGLDDTALNDPQSGFRAMVFRDDEGHHVIAYRGTDDRRDWIANVDQALGRPTDQFEEAMDVAGRLMTACAGDLALTGHSLGGGLAAAAAMATGLTAVTFDASGVHLHTAEVAARRRGQDRNAQDVLGETGAGQIRAYHAETDPLTGLQESPAGRDLPTAPGMPIVRPTVDVTTRQAWAAAGRRSGPVLGAVAAGTLSGLNPVVTGLGALAGAKVGSDAFVGLHGHLYHAIDAAMDQLFPEGADPS